MNALQAGAASQAKRVSVQYDQFWRQDTRADFGKWTMNGVEIGGSGQLGTLQLAPGSPSLQCSSIDIDGGAAHYDSSAGLCAGTDPYPPGGYDHGINYYNGGNFYFGTATSPVITTQNLITTVISSWNAATPAGTWMEVHVRVQEGNNWTHWYILPIWASDFSTIHRHSVNRQTDKTGTVATDTFYTIGQRASSYQLRLTLFTQSAQATPVIRRVAAIASNDGSVLTYVPPDQSVWGTNLSVPQRSQMLKKYHGLGYGGGGEVWCSPTSTSMVMAYWSTILHQQDLNQTVPDAAKGTYDFTYKGTGNWPFNTGYAASFGLRAFVTRMYSMSQIEQWIKVGVPIVISIAYKKGELPGSPIPSSTGHLLVVRGFAPNGDVITNDPAAKNDQAVQIVYSRSALQHVWLKYSNGTVYVIYPESWPTPTTDALGSW